MNIVLTGFMASGKTQISKELSKLTGFSLVDTDAVIEEKTGLSINDIFEKFGESKFRDIEHDVIKKYQNVRIPLFQRAAALFLILII